MHTEFHYLRGCSRSYPHVFLWAPGASQQGIIIYVGVSRSYPHVFYGLLVLLRPFPSLAVGWETKGVLVKHTAVMTSSKQWHRYTYGAPIVSGMKCSKTGLLEPDLIYNNGSNGMADEKETCLLDSLKELEKDFKEGYKLTLRVLLSAGIRLSWF